MPSQVQSSTLSETLPTRSSKAPSIVAITDEDRTFLKVIIAGKTYNYYVSASRLCLFTNRWPNGIENAERDYTLDFGEDGFVELGGDEDASSGLTKALKVAHGTYTARANIKATIHEIWQLAILEPRCGFSADIMQWMSECMQNNVAQLRDNGIGLSPKTWEEGIRACAVLENGDSLHRELVAYLAFLCSTTKDSISGEVGLVVPRGAHFEHTGGRARERCLSEKDIGSDAYDAIFRARAYILDKVIEGVKESVWTWMGLLHLKECKPCSAPLMGCLITALIHAGLFPMKTPHTITKSLWQIGNDLAPDSKGETNSAYSLFPGSCPECFTEYSWLATTVADQMLPPNKLHGELLDYIASHSVRPVDDVHAEDASVGDAPHDVELYDVSVDGDERSGSADMDHYFLPKLLSCHVAD